MIIQVSEIVTSGVIWFCTELHALGKAHAQAQQQLIIDKKTYCPPVITLPKDLSDWQIIRYDDQCKGVNGYLQDKVPESKLITPVDTPAPALELAK